MARDKDKEKWFNKGYMLVLDLTLDFVEKNDPKLYDQIKFDLENIDLVYTHTLPSNDIDMVNAIVSLSSQKLLAPEIALQSLNFIPNVQDYMEGVMKWNEIVDKSKESQDNKNSGMNQHNLDLQNSIPQTKDQQDNLKNAILGRSQKLG